MVWVPFEPPSVSSRSGHYRRLSLVIISDDTGLLVPRFLFYSFEEVMEWRVDDTTIVVGGP